MPESTTASIRTAIIDYLNLLDGQPKTERADLKALTVALDRLVAEYQATGDVEVLDEAADAPPVAFQPLYDRAGASYPTLGYYAHVEPDEDVNVRPGLADAIDDLADIARDLTDVLWHIDRGRFTDAVWHFRYDYQIHWGAHLHSLRVYLHSSNIAAW